MQKSYVTTENSQAVCYNVARLGNGQMFGEYEALNGLKYEYSLVCRTIKGELLAMDAQEFMRKLSPHPDSLQMINDNAKLKNF
jgi:CRP-like cAMP-binding protein